MNKIKELLLSRDISLRRVNRKFHFLWIILSLFILFSLAVKVLANGVTYINIAPEAEVSSYQTSPGYPERVGGLISNVTDLNVNTWWYGEVRQETPNWVELAWKTTRTISRIAINFGGSRCAVDYKIQTWNGKSWDDRIVITGNNSDPVTHYLDQGINGVSTFKLRLFITRTAISDHIQRIREFDVYEKQPLSISNILLVYFILPLKAFMNYGLFLSFVLVIISIGIYWNHQYSFFNWFESKRENLFIALTSMCILFAGLLIAYFENLSCIRGIPGEWIWVYQPISDITERLWLPVIIFACSILIVARFALRKYGWDIKNNIITGKSLIFLFFLAYSLQLGVFFLNRGGFAGLTEIINCGVCFGYFGEAVKVQNIHSFLENYASSMPHLSFHVSAKPPGGVLLLWLINQLMKCFPFLANLIIKIGGTIGIDTASLGNELLASNLVAGSIFSGFLLPLIGSFTIVPLYYLGKEVYSKEIGLYASILYLVIPGMILFIPQFDQMYPLVATLSVYLFYLGLKRKRSLYICLSAFILSFGLFMSFAFLVIVALLFFLMLAFFIRGGENSSKEYYLNSSTYISMLKTSLIVLFTIGILYGIIYFVLHVDMLEVYQAALSMDSKMSKEAYRTDFRWRVVNLYDFFIFGGIAIFPFFIKKTVSELRKIRNKNAVLTMDPLFAAFFITFLLLDVSGKVSGEVGRVFLFLVPFVVLLVSSEFGGIKLKKNKIVLLIFILSLQFIQTVIFKRSFLV